MTEPPTERRRRLSEVIPSPPLMVHAEATATDAAVLVGAPHELPGVVSVRELVRPSLLDALTGADAA